MLAEAVRKDARSFGALARAVGWTLLRLSAYIGVVLLAGFVIGMPLLVLTMIIAVVSPVMSQITLLFASAAWVWLGIYIGFAREAIAMAQLGPLRAIYVSFQIVRRSFWSTVGLLALTLVVAVGCGVIWMQIAGTPLGTGLAIIGSAYIGVGLIAARMVFFREQARRANLAQPGVIPVAGR
jgi:hypothetical protein